VAGESGRKRRRRELRHRWLPRVGVERSPGAPSGGHTPWLHDVPRRAHSMARSRIRTSIHTSGRVAVADAVPGCGSPGRTGSTLFARDWGGRIGLRVVGENPDLSNLDKALRDLVQRPGFDLGFVRRALPPGGPRGRGAAPPHDHGSATLPPGGQGNGASAPPPGVHPRFQQSPATPRTLTQSAPGFGVAQACRRRRPGG
jgi:hypothetical protein